MSEWLDPVRNALDLSPEPINFFFRDDDGGWGDDRLFKLLDLFADYDLPIDLAIIPQALTPALARKILGRIEKNRERIALHQHGFAHVNHEAEGRKCEFGPARAREQQDQDIASGKRILAESFGPILQPIFTPPWNRCTAETGDCLIRLGFRILSRDSSAAPLDISGLCELPVRVDWFANRKGVRLNTCEVGLLVADAVRDAKPVGVMFHHALMDGDERRAARELLALLAANSRARCRPMQSLG
ncbi:MAG TPA: hypothetical protein VF131_13800 [Blastocatellia bacterium]|nr:hypothetical protein [Blastocatellia bacterium]